MTAKMFAKVCKLLTEIRNPSIQRQAIDAVEKVEGLDNESERLLFNLWHLLRVDIDFTGMRGPEEKLRCGSIIIAIMELLGLAWENQIPEIRSPSAIWKIDFVFQAFLGLIQVATDPEIISRHDPEFIKKMLGLAKKLRTVLQGFTRLDDRDGTLGAAINVLAKALDSRNTELESFLACLLFCESDQGTMIYSEGGLSEQLYEILTMLIFKRLDQKCRAFVLAHAIQRGSVFPGLSISLTDGFARGLKGR
jgi:hypothetical protein